MQLEPRSAVSSWSLSGWLASTTLATLAFWSMFGACVDASDASAPEGGDCSAGASPAQAESPCGVPPSAVRAVIAWDPRACGAPHRVIVELEDPGGAGEPGGGASGGGEPLAASVPCALGEVTLDAPRPGIYTGRAYAWSDTVSAPSSGSAASMAASASTSSTVPLVLVLEASVTRVEVPAPR